MRVVIAHDHALFRDGLGSLLEAHGIEVAGEARTGHEDVEQTRRLRPDLVLMDRNMPELLADAVRHGLPNASTSSSPESYLGG